MGFFLARVFGFVESSFVEYQAMLHQNTLHKSEDDILTDKF
jgi:hypothetical protein